MVMMTYVHAFSQIVLFVAVHDAFDQPGQVGLVAVQFGVRGRHGVASTISGRRVRRMRSSRAFVVEARSGDVVVLVTTILETISGHF